MLAGKYFDQEEKQLKKLQLSQITVHYATT